MKSRGNNPRLFLIWKICDGRIPGEAVFAGNLTLAAIEIIDEALLAENHQTKDTGNLRRSLADR